MADVTVIEAISLLTKVSADTSSLIKKLSTRIDNIESIPGVKNKEKEKLVKKAEPVMVTDFGKAAEKDLAKLGGDAENERIRIEKEKNTNNQLLKLLGIAGAAALALKFLFDGEGITGLVQGFQKAYKIVANFANRAKGLIDDIGKRLGTFADDIGKKVGTIVDDVIAKTNTWAKSAKDGIKNAMDDIGRRLGTFGDDIARGLTTVVNNAKNIASRVAQTGTNLVDDITRSATRGAMTGAATGTAAPAPSVARQPSRFSRFLSKGLQFGGDVLEKGKNVGKKVIEKGKVVGGVVVDKGQKALKFTKDKILAPLKSAVRVVKPLAILKGIAKSPLLAPALEAFFAGKDIKNFKDQYAAGEIDTDTLNFEVGKRLIKAVTGVIGGLTGAAIGAPLGSAIPGIGNIITAIAGGVLGDVAGRLIGGVIADAMGPKAGTLGEFALNTKFLGGGIGFAEPTEIDDGIILKDGKVIKPDAQDTLYAMKDGGPLFKALDKTPKMIGNLMEVELESRNLLKEQNLLLREILLKTGVVINAPGKTNNTANFDQSGDTFRSLQSGY